MALRRTKIARGQCDKWLNNQSAFQVGRATGSSEASPDEEMAAELDLVFEDDRGRQTVEFYHLTGTTHIEGPKVISADTPTAGTAQRHPVTATFAITPTHIVNSLAVRARRTLNVTPSDGTYAGDVDLARVPERQACSPCTWGLLSQTSG